MANTSNPGSLPRSRYGWRWLLIAAAGMAWLSIGCNPQTLSMLVMPFSDNNVEPEYKLFAKKKELTLLILTNYKRQQVHPDLQAADIELADLLAAAIRKRCEDNSHKIKIVPNAQARSRQLTGAGVYTPDEIGKHFKADYVLELTVNSLSIKEKNHYPEMYRGQIILDVNLYQVDAKDGNHKVFGPRQFSRLFPKSMAPIDATSMTPAGFRNIFLGKVAGDVSKMFIAYPPEERREMD